MTMKVSSYRLKFGYYLEIGAFVKGFTLAELLICIYILGLIATFTIPKLITPQQNSKYNAIAKEDISMVSAAYQQYQLLSGASSNTSIGDITPYMNYVSVSNSLVVDDVQGNSSFACSSTYPCLILHNGSVLHYGSTASFGGSSTTNANWFQIDPNGAFGGTTNGSDKAGGFFIYFNGLVTDEGDLKTGTANSVQSYSANSSKVLTWFGW